MSTFSRPNYSLTILIYFKKSNREKYKEKNHTGGFQKKLEKLLLHLENQTKCDLINFYSNFISMMNGDRNNF